MWVRSEGARQALKVLPGKGEEMARREETVPRQLVAWQS